MENLRLQVDGPYTDESTSSVLDRVAARYRIASQELVYRLCPELRRNPTTDIDRHWNNSLRKTFASALQIDQDTLIDLPDRCLGGNARTSYCPRCFVSDLADRRTPYFRWYWSIPMLTFCPEHQCPLFNWRKVQWRRRVIPYGWATRPWTGQQFLCNFLAEDLAAADQVDSMNDADRQRIELVRRLEADMVNITDRHNWVRDESALLGLVEPVLGACVDLLASTAKSEARRIGRQPDQEGLFALETKGLHSYKRGSSFSSFTRIRKTSWRRSILWAAATVVYDEQTGWITRLLTASGHPLEGVNLGTSSRKIPISPLRLMDNVRLRAHQARYVRCRRSASV